MHKRAIVKEEENRIPSLSCKHGGKFRRFLGQPFLQMASHGSRAAPAGPWTLSLTAQVLCVVNTQLEPWNLSKLDFWDVTAVVRFLIAQFEDNFDAALNVDEKDSMGIAF